jgi:hypothetical protein
MKLGPCAQQHSVACCRVVADCILLCCAVLYCAVLRQLPMSEVGQMFLRNPSILNKTPATLAAKAAALRALPGLQPAQAAAAMTVLPSLLNLDPNKLRVRWQQLQQVGAQPAGSPCSHDRTCVDAWLLTAHEISCRMCQSAIILGGSRFHVCGILSVAFLLGVTVNDPVCVWLSKLRLV